MAGENTEHEDEGGHEVVGEYLTEIVKRHVVGEVPAGSVPVEKLSLTETDPLAPSNVLPNEQDQARVFNGGQAILPPYDPGALTILFEQSNALGSNVEAYKTNIDSYGHRFEPVIDLDASDADQKIGDAMFLERMNAVAGDDVPQAAYPTPDEIANRRKEIEQLMRLERARLDTRFSECVPGSTFRELRQQSRQELEVTGNAYWEVIRNGKNEVAQFTYVPAYSVRLLPIDLAPIDVRVLSRISAFTYEPTTQRRRFRRFVQVINAQVVWFKEYEDPRIMSARTGQYYPSLEALEKAEGMHGVEATEMIHFRIFSSRSPYGVPRWVGNMLAVLGSRASEEVNFIYFDNKAVPPLAVLVAGGTLTEDAATRIKEHVQKKLKGRKNFHQILIIEAQAQATPGAPPNTNRVTVQIEQLTGSQQQDGLFQTYDQNNIDKVGSSFRNPRLLRGDIRDFNKATADAALQFAELQVYQPLRGTFDDFMNERVLAPMGVRYWRFQSNGPVVKDPQALSEIVEGLTSAGILTPEEARTEAGAILSRDLKKIDAEWTTQPLAMTLAGIMPDGITSSDIATATGAAPAAADGKTPDPPKATPEQRALSSVAANLSMLRDRLRGASKAAAERTAKEERAAFDASQVITIEVSREEMDQLVKRDDPTS